MARKASVIMTPAEKKLAIDTTKVQIKEAKQKFGATASLRDAAQRQHTKELAALDKARAAAVKAHENALKAHAKKRAALIKVFEAAEKKLARQGSQEVAALDKLNAALTQLTPPPPVVRQLELPLGDDEVAIPSPTS